MQYVRFGNAGIQVSRVCVGCMDFPERLDESESMRLIDTALENGVNLFDTADGYLGGASEEFLGRAFKDRRDQALIATKFWIRTYRRPNGGGCSRVHIMQAAEDSLRRLQTDYIDIYQMHHPDINTPVEETISTLDTLVKQGKIRYYGVSNHYAWQMAHMLAVSALHNWEPLVSVQCRYNVMDRPIEIEIAPFVQRFNIATMIYSPLQWGMLAGAFERGKPLPEDTRLGRSKRYKAEYLTDEAFDVVDRLKEIAARYGITLAQLSIAWLLAKPYVTTVILGGSKREHFEPLYSTPEITLDPEDVRQIDEAGARYRFIPFHNQGVVSGAPLGLNRM